MKNTSKISLSLPGTNISGTYFSLRIKSELYNERSIYSNPSKIFALSDIEGNFNSFRRLLLKNRVIDLNYHWTFDDGHLVIVGDCFDRGEQVTECLWLIYSLEEKARKEGGYVHFILGNHEIMNMNGDWRYIHPKYAIASRSHASRTALYGGNNELWRWLRTKNIMEKIGNILFVHGGIAPKFLQLNEAIADINNRIRPFYNRTHELFDVPLLNVVFNSEASPFWYRGYYQQGVSEELIDATLAHFRVDSIVTGHTIVDNVSTYFNGKVINVNTDHAAGNSQALFIKKNRFYKVDMDGKRERIK